jgi:hypothetical protein
MINVVGVLDSKNDNEFEFELLIDGKPVTCINYAPDSLYLPKFMEEYLHINPKEAFETLIKVYIKFIFANYINMYIFI